MEPDHHIRVTFSDIPHLLTVLSVDDALYAILKFLAISSHDDSHSLIKTLISVINDDHSLMLHTVNEPTVNGVYFGNQQSILSEYEEEYGILTVVPGDLHTNINCQLASTVVCGP